MSRDRFANIGTNGISATEPYDPPFTHGGGGGGRDLEMQQVGHHGGGGGGGGSYDDMEKFNEEVSSIQSQIKTYNSQVSEISALQNQRFAALDTTNSDISHLDDSISHQSTLNSSLSASIKSRIQALNTSTNRLPPNRNEERNVRKLQIETLRKRFLEAIENYQQVEKGSRDRVRLRLERQVRIVKPDASEEEVKQAVRDAEEEGASAIFSQINASRMSEARNVLGEVRDRSKEIKKIEKTLVELASLFNEMSIALDEQGEQLEEIEEKQGLITQDVMQTVGILGKGKVSARNYRKGRWLMLWISLVVLIVIAIIVAVLVLKNKKN